MRLEKLLLAIMAFTIADRLARKTVKSEAKSALGCRTHFRLGATYHRWHICCDTVIGTGVTRLSAENFSGAYCSC